MGLPLDISPSRYHDIISIISISLLIKPGLRSRPCRLCMYTIFGWQGARGTRAFGYSRTHTESVRDTRVKHKRRQVSSITQHTPREESSKCSLQFNIAGSLLDGQLALSRPISLLHWQFALLRCVPTVMDDSMRAKGCAARAHLVTLAHI